MTEPKDLGLDEDTAKVAQELADRFPFVVFSSVARTIQDQARAMAQNTVKNRNWIKQTYKQSTCSESLVQYLAKNPNKKSESELTDGFLQVLKLFKSDELRKLSKHISDASTGGSRAFDIVPIVGSRGNDVKNFLILKAASLGGLFLTKEGGLERWHFQL